MSDITLNREDLAVFLNEVLQHGIPEAAYMRLADLIAGHRDGLWRDLDRLVKAVDGEFYLPCGVSFDGRENAVSDEDSH